MQDATIRPLIGSVYFRRLSLRRARNIYGRVVYARAQGAQLRSSPTVFYTVASIAGRTPSKIEFQDKAKLNRVD